jgi:hypothetical protein
MRDGQFFHRVSVFYSTDVKRYLFKKSPYFNERFEKSNEQGTAPVDDGLSTAAGFRACEMGGLIGQEHLAPDRRRRQNDHQSKITDGHAEDRHFLGNTLTAPDLRAIAGRDIPQKLPVLGKPHSWPNERIRLPHHVLSSCIGTRRYLCINRRTHIHKDT